MTVEADSTSQATEEKPRDVERYPDQDFDEDLYQQLLDLPDGGKIDIEFVKKHIWNEAEKFTVPKDKVYKGMQANMFVVNISNKNRDIFDI